MPVPRSSIEAGVLRVRLMVLGRECILELMLPLTLILAGAPLLVPSPEAGAVLRSEVRIRDPFVLADS